MTIARKQNLSGLRKMLQKTVVLLGMSRQREMKAGPSPLQSNKELNTGGEEQKGDMSHPLTQQF